MNTKSLKLAALTFAAMYLPWSVPSEAQEQARVSRSNDNLNYQQALQRGTQTVIWGVPAVSMMDCIEGRNAILALPSMASSTCHTRWRRGTDF